MVIGGGFILVVVGLLAVFAVIRAIGDITHAAAMRAWPSADAKITESTVAKTRARDSSGNAMTLFRPHLVFAFEANGQEHEGDNAKYAEPLARGDAQQIVEDNPPGTILTVYYDPDEPAVVVLDNEPPYLSGETLAYLVPGVGYAVFFCGWIIPAILRRRRQAVRGA